MLKRTMVRLIPKKVLADERINVPQPFTPKKSLGQNFLTSTVVPMWMCDAGDVGRNDSVLEIGPGTGVLTREILTRGARVMAVETDPRAVAMLAETFAPEINSNQLTLVRGDIRTLDLTTLGLPERDFKVIANIPYYLSGFLLRTFLTMDQPPKTLVFLMQKEVVHRITRDRKGSLLSLSVKSFGTPEYIKTVTRGHFSPSPHVDSAILRVTHISRANFKTLAEQERFFSILHLGFGQKRKQLLSNLTKDYSRHDLERQFAELAFSPTARAEELTLDQWLALFEKLKTIRPS